MTSQELSPFAELGLPEPLLQALRDVGYETPSPIQAATIPPLLVGRDVLGQAQTGTGKTAAFALPILAKIDCNARHTQALVLAPTRELAIQVAEAFARYATHLPGFNVLPIYGGQSYIPQLASLKRGAHVVVGTPGRVIDHLERGTLKLDQLSHMVLDEADEMLRMGFIDDVESILQKTPPERQVALFSATMPSAIRRIAQTYLRDPAEITIKAATTTATHIRQRYWMVSGFHKLDALTRILEVEPFDGMIIFARTKQATEELAEKLAARGFTAAALNGDVPQALRERMVQRLKDGQLDILVATDVAARGLDVERISHVVNYDIPTDTESYVHRIGRTGRAGRSGDAILFVTPRERHLLRAIERATRQPITQMQLPSTEAVNDSRINRFMQRITEAREQEGLEDYQRLVERYEQEFDIPAIEIAAALARMVQGNKPLLMRPGSDLAFSAEAQTPRREREPRESRSPRAERAPHGEKTPERAPRERAKPRDLEAFTQTLMQVREESGVPQRHAHARDEHESRPPRAERQPRSGHEAEGLRFETYRVEVGRDHGVEVRNLVGAIANEAGLENKHIGNIAIRGDHSFVELPEGMPKDVFRTLQKTWVSGRQLQLSKAEPVRDTARDRPAARGASRRFDAGDAPQAPRRRAAPMPAGGKSFKRKP
ncbi:DEAD/DEAH box helicase [Thiomonas bhubaneswarensis]|uniref:ATP-dependent RNA helicase DeaD n=1 Tax=Thiomonas bhubaneswarensis TaxID=339866 RepID=A0A0K6I4N9_9BURK|nr:DEAD/DEAH box helicase [Thiomonas bhubaneswarensis]CUA98070.1 ATP-dependent RNA helicase CsdA [Thiomonas bhubaneswarensis]